MTSNKPIILFLGRAFVGCGILSPMPIGRLNVQFTWKTIGEDIPALKQYCSNDVLNYDSK